jgi:hypothetical protein
MDTGQGTSNSALLWMSEVENRNKKAKAEFDILPSLRQR